MAFTSHGPFSGHEDQFHFVRRGLSTMNKETLAANPTGGTTAIHASDTNLATLVATSLNYPGANVTTVHEDQTHVFLRAAKIVYPALSAAGILTDADIANNLDTVADSRSQFLTQDASLPATYQPDIGDC